MTYTLTAQQAEQLGLKTEQGQSESPAPTSAPTPTPVPTPDPLDTDNAPTQPSVPTDAKPISFSDDGYTITFYSNGQYTQSGSVYAGDASVFVDVTDTYSVDKSGVLSLDTGNEVSCYASMNGFDISFGAPNDTSCSAKNGGYTISFQVPANGQTYVIGDFHWTAWDYLGEAGVGLPVYGTSKAPFSKSYPAFTANCGSVDLTGLPESAAMYTAILWGAYDMPYIGVRPVNHSGEEYALGNWRMTDSVSSWTWPGCEGRTAEIEVFSPGAEAELLQEGTSLGRKPLDHCKARFEAVYRPGTLTAVAYDAENSVEPN